MGKVIKVAHLAWMMPKPAWLLHLSVIMDNT